MKNLAVPIKYDQNLLQVQTVGPQTSLMSFEVTPVDTLDHNLETQVVFDVGNDETRILMVRFEPSAK